MMRKQNVQNVHDKGCSNQGKHETFKREDKREMKEKPTKAKKKGRTIRAFKRDISLWLLCSGRNPDIHLQLHSDVWCTDRVPPL